MEKKRAGAAAPWHDPTPRLLLTTLISAGLLAAAAVAAALATV
ncbi:MAG TPA: hypothetical protein VLD39_02375 [Gammaproteobacteria bacterium]|nr:hypothetical protein [Gammaproteobacteria bacterium]